MAESAETNSIEKIGSEAALNNGTGENSQTSQEDINKIVAEQVEEKIQARLLREAKKFNEQIDGLNAQIKTLTEENEKKDAEINSAKALREEFNILKIAKETSLDEDTARKFYSSDKTVEDTVEAIKALQKSVPSTTRHSIVPSDKSFDNDGDAISDIKNMIIKR